MLKSIKDFFSNILNSIFPERNDFGKIKKLTKEDIENLPKSNPVEGYDFIYPLFQYKDDTVRALIWELKYKENTLPLEHIGQIMYDQIIQIASDILIFNNDIKFAIVPIPISKMTRIERGFNQSELIAKSIIEYDIDHIFLYAPQWLEKIKDTPKQSKSLSREERLKNLSGAFYANPKISNYTVFLIDDVSTTGSTIYEATKTLKQAGVKDVFAFTIAH